MLALAAISAAVPDLVRARPIGTYTVIAGGEGDQTDPSLDAQHVVLASDAGGDRDVLLYEIGAPAGSPLALVAGGLGDQDQPDIQGTAVAFRGPDGVHLASWGVGADIRAPGPSSACGADAREREPTISDQAAAWVCGEEGARDVAVARYRDGLEEYLLLPPGAASGERDRFAPSAFRSLVAFVDGADGGAVWLHDSEPLRRSTSRVCDGRATGVAVGDLAGTVLAVARASGGLDEDIEIWDAGGALTTLRVRGEQRNPHIAGDWVAFEDLSTGRGQVVLWQWTTGLAFLPRPSTSDQTLNDLAVVAGAEVRVAFAERREPDSDRDVALYRLAIVNGEVPDDGEENELPWDRAPARCDDVDPAVLGTLELSRGEGKPVAGSLTFEVPFRDAPGFPILVCMDAARVSAAWITLDDRVVASPAAFEPHVTHLAVPAFAEDGAATIAGVLAGGPGASLVARVLADPGRVTEGGGGASRAAPAAAGRGCGNGGGGPSIVAFVVVALLRAARRRR